MKKLISSAAVVSLFLMISSCQTNPLLEEWDTPFGIAPFEQIQTEHYLPAFKKAMQEHLQEIKTIVNNRQEPDFENTILAYDHSGERLEKIDLIFSNACSMSATDTLMSLAQEIYPMLESHYDDIRMNQALFNRIESVYRQRENLGLERDQIRTVELIYREFQRSGIQLQKTEQEELKKINARISELELKFEQNLLKETSSYSLLVKNEDQLKGLSAEQRVEAAQRAGRTDQWIFGLDNPSILPFLTFANNRALRKEILTAYLNRCNHDNEYDNKKIVEELLRNRLQKARLLGYDNYASYILEDRMAKTPEAVDQLLKEVWKPAMAVAEKELKDIRKCAKPDGITNEIHHYDWRYYAAKVERQKYNLLQGQVCQYFLIDNVREGMFYVARRLYGLTFRELTDVPVPHPEATAWECRDRDGNHVGILFLDLYARPGEKSGGAWCTSYREQTYEGDQKITPILSIVCNFSRPGKNDPTLLTTDETETMFHEFGHAVQGLLQNVRYKTLADIPTDFVELPSQMFEHWAYEPEVLALYARHFISGEKMPKHMMERIVETEKYGQGFATVENIAAAALDMAYHELKEIPEDFDVEKFEEQLFCKMGLDTEIIAPRYRTTYFSHTMGGGYTAGYYSYLWSSVLDNDAYQAFKETGDIFNPEVAIRFRKEVLEKSNEKEPMESYENFRGRKPDVSALLRSRGLD